MIENHTLKYCCFFDKRDHLWNVYTKNKYFTFLLNRFYSLKLMPNNIRILRHKNYDVYRLDLKYIKAINGVINV